MFHMLRRQVLRRLRKPLVVMTPKSLLRLRPTFSPLPDFLSGGFRRLIDDDMDTATAAGVGRVLLCNGRIYWDLIAHRNSTGRRDVAILRVEQLYPFPSSAAAAALARYPSTALVGWIQDEPRNMGAWTFLRPLLEEHLGSRTLRYVGRPESASPATGSSDSHKLEQEMILEEAFNG
jgi:2-oxoglutarate dehydrogenase E1 component